MTTQLSRIGALGCAAIVNKSLPNVLPQVPQVALTTMASRTAERARTFAAQHSIPGFHWSGVKGLQVIDDIYRAAGMRLRRLP